jgi:hypothetical protein
MASRAVFELVERLMVTAKAFNRVREQLVHPARIHCPTQRHVTNTGLEGRFAITLPSRSFLQRQKVWGEGETRAGRIAGVEKEQLPQLPFWRTWTGEAVGLAGGTLFFEAAKNARRLRK